MVDRPLADKRPIGPFVQGENSCKLMVGFPVELPRKGEVRPESDFPDNPILEIKDEITRRFPNVDRGDINVTDVNLSGFEPPVVKFISFPVKDNENTATARSIGDYPDRVNKITREVLNDDLNANVSVWAGDERSGRSISNK